VSDACAASWRFLRKELRTYFGSLARLPVAAAFLAYTGYYFHSDLIYFVTSRFGFSITGEPGSWCSWTCAWS
jgi:hypothetical protein